MSSQLYLKPTSTDAHVRMPERNNQLMPEYGDAVPNNQYYMRRFRDGELVKTSLENIKKGRAAELKKQQDAAKKAAAVASDKTQSGDK